MKTITTAIQAILDADQNFPVTVAVITLNDGTILYVADKAVTISAQAYAGDLMGPPTIVVDSSSGIDHTNLKLNNGDWTYSPYDNSDLFDGARVTVSQYFATDDSYGSFVGPVLAFSGVISQPTTSGEGVIELTVLADGRVSDEGTIGRTITGRCLNTFGDANCGYVESGTIASSGTYVAGTSVGLSETAVAGQLGNGFLALYPSSNTHDRVLIKRAGVTIYGAAQTLYIASADFAIPGIEAVRFNIDVTVQAGDKVVYADCPRDSARSCARRWKIGSAARQQDNFMGLDYLRRNVSFSTVTESRYDENLGSIIPLAYGERWVEPLFIGLHQDRDNLGLAAWNSSKKGPFVIALLSEGPVDTGIVNAETDIELDGKLAKESQFYSGGVGEAVSVKTGAVGQTVSDYAPLPDSVGALSHIPGWSALPNVAYLIFDLPDEYDVSTEVIDVNSPSLLLHGRNARSPDVRIGPRHVLQPKKPALRVKLKGRQVYTWSYVGTTPTKSGSPVYSANPVWILLDKLTAPYRIADSDIFSVSVAETDLDLGSFIDWAGYCDETLTAYDQFGNSQSVNRFVASLFHATPDRAAAIQAVLDSMRASLVFRRGKIGLTIDAPLGGKGTATSGATTYLEDSRRADPTGFPAVPSWPTGGVNGLLAGLKVKILAGTGAGQVRTIASNTKVRIVPTVNFSPAPDATSQYAIYAVEINKDNCDNVVRKKDVASHAVTNKILVQFEADEYRGRTATLPVPDTSVDGQGNTHIDRFGFNEETLDLPAVTTFQQVARLGWFKLRKGLDCNRIFEIQDVNITGLPLEVGDLVLFSHDIDGVANEMVRVERIEDSGQGKYTIVARLYREHIYVDWPTDSFHGLDISSNLVNPHAVPPHVIDMAATALREDANSPPLIVVTYTPPQWPYAGWTVLIEARYKDAEDEWTEWKLMATSRDASSSFRAAELADYEVRAVFMSHVGVRADAAITQGTSSGSNSASTLNDTSKVWEVDRYVGKSVLITGGVDAGDETVVTANTETQLSVTPDWAVTPDATSLYKVYAPAAVESLLVNPADSDTGIRLVKLNSDRTRIRFRIVYGSDITHVCLWDREYEHSTLLALAEATGETLDRLSEPDDDAADWDRVLFPDEATDETIEFVVPYEGRERWITFRPISTGGRKGSGFHFPIYPTGEAADRIISVAMQVNSVTGAPEITLIVDPRSSSVRGAFNVGAVGVAAPTDEDVEVSGGTALGGFTENIVGSDVLALPAGTTGYDQEIVLRVCAYLGENGLDDKGRNLVHGEIKEVRALRQKPPVSLDVEADDSDPDEGVATVTLHDEAGFTDAIRARRKIGDADWSAPFDVTLAPVDGGEYIVTVDKVERHPSTLEIWAEGFINGAAFRVPVEVPAFDAGRIPNVIVIPKLDEESATATGTIIGDSDTEETKLVAARNSAPLEATVDAATPIVGRSVLYTDVGTLVSGLVPGDIVHYAWRGIGPNGESQSAINRAAVPYLVIAPSLDPTTTEENQATGVATFGVTVRDTAAQADLLEFQTRTEGDAWPASWTTKSASPSDGVEYSETVNMVEGHGAQIRFRLKFTMRGKVREIILESPVFDPGLIPRVSIRPILQEDLDVTADVMTNFDTRSIKIVAAIGSPPSDATVRAATAIDVPAGQAGVYASDVGTLLSADPSDEIYIKVFGYSAVSGGGTESPEPVVAYVQAATVSALNPRIISCDQSAAPFDDGTDISVELTWSISDAPVGDYVLDLQVLLEGAVVDTVSAVSLSESQPYVVTGLAGGSGTSGLDVVVRFLLKRLSDSVYVDSRDTPVRLTEV